jgi:hypothetical protein
MYGYYLISTLGYDVWWKKYLTQLQISQLSLFVVQVRGGFFGVSVREYLCCSLELQNLDLLGSSMDFMLPLWSFCSLTFTERATIQREELLQTKLELVRSMNNYPLSIHSTSLDHLNNYHCTKSL